MHSRIIGTGSYLPERVVHNADLEKVMETSDAWIRSRTGIERRHYAADGQTTVDMAEQAARRAIQAAGLVPTDIDLIVFGTTTPDLVFPNAGAMLQARLGCKGGPALADCDLALVVPSMETGRIQESHITIGHALMELIEDGLLARGKLNRV